MSVTVSYFFNHPTDLQSLAQQINAWVGCSLSPYGGDSEDLFCRVLGIELSLSKHTLENDRDANFEDFKYQLQTRTAVSDNDLRCLQLTTMSSLAYAMYRRMKIAGMLVHGVQTVLARYEERAHGDSRDPRLFDLISARFVSFPEHFESLHALCEIDI